MINFHVISIFPEMVESYVSESILKRAKGKNLINFHFYKLREYTSDKHGKVDDKPYGGGPGMVLTAQPILECVNMIKNNLKKNYARTILKVIIFVPNAKKWTNADAKTYAKKYTDIIFICGRYEGIDYRVQKILKAESISIGDYVLTGGEVPAMILIDSISRQVKGVLGDFNSIEETRTNVLGEQDAAVEEFYTRPETLMWKNKKHSVPEVFLSGNPKLIKEYKNKDRTTTKEVV